MLFLAGLLAAIRLPAQRIAISKQTYYPFLVDLPAAEVLDNKPPVVLFLHGRSLSGGKLERVQRYGLMYSMDLGKVSLPAVVVAPHSQGGWNPDKLLEVIDYVVENYCADPERVYVCGMSMGGYGTLDLAGKYPDRIAAAVAICGGGAAQYACGLSKIPIWLQHGTSDRIVPASESKKIAGAIRACNTSANLTLTLIDGGTHGSVERIFHQYDIYNWMFRHKKQNGEALLNDGATALGL
ncbi:hypothetical protein GCM10023091_24900 [Ravibacter arvi]|uniref:Phospholipase/carboxylesterase/thioesterase domain-containing protein n=1 Tax=Ravibacter arvi TaxID=2051041 RepID=A0ABP8LYZ5_9BACT